MKRGTFVWVLAFAALCAFFWVTSAWLSELVDDAFIAFRYSRNLIEGQGLVYNPGERVEGFVNLLWVLAMAAAYAVGLDMALFSQVLSTGCAALLVVSLVSFSLRYFRDEPFPWISGLAGALLALNPLFSHTVGFGLETVFFSLLTWASVASFLGLERGSSRAVWTGVLLALSYLTRPEAALWTVCFAATGAVQALRHPSERATRIAQVATYCAIFLGVVAAHLAWRYSYYGDLFPNPAYVKVVDNWKWGLWTLQDFALSGGLLPVVALIGVPLFLRRPWALCVWAIVTLYLCFVLRTGGSRYLFPLLPLVYLLVQELTREVLARQGRRVRWVFVGGLLLAFCVGALREGERAHSAAAFSRMQNKRNARLGQCLAQATTPNDAIALIPAGVIAYYAERPIIDMLGLNDKHIARHGRVDVESIIGHQRSDADYVLARRPRIILVSPKANPQVPILAIREILAHPDLHEIYEPAQLRCERLREPLFVRKDQPLGEYGQRERQQER